MLQLATFTSGNVRGEGNLRDLIGFYILYISECLLVEMEFTYKRAIIYNTRVFALQSCS